MKFKKENVNTFLTFLEEYKPQIRNFPGCEMVEFLQDINDPSILMTHSLWQDPQDLENYRQSDLFKHVWANTKIHFENKAEAHTFKILDKL